MKLYEILVPALWNAGRIIPLAVHHGWDNWVSGRIGGLTILRDEHRGVWDGKHESVIRVRIGCDEKQLQDILKFTAQYYDQKAVAAYEVSPNFIVFHAT